MKKFLLKLLFVFCFFSFLFPLNISAQQNAEESEQYIGGMKRKMDNQTTAFFGESGYSGARADTILGTIIKTVLSLLGIVFLVLMIFSGYQWMTAGGNEDQVTQAKSRIKNAVIGVIIVVMAYAITAFVFKNLSGGSSQIQTTDPQNP